MKKKICCGAAILLMIGMLGGCGTAVVEELPLYQMNVDKYVTLGDYKNIDVSAEAYEVDEETLNGYLASVYASYAYKDFGTVERAVMDGDTANIDYEGKLDGVAFQGGTDQDYDLTIGSGGFIDGFEEGLIGVMPGETVVLNLTFPENYDNGDLAGKETVFTVTVNYVIPGNEEDMENFVVTVMGLEEENILTIAGLKEYLRGLLEEEYQYYYESELESNLLDALVAQCTFEELPEYMIESYKELMTRNVESSAKQYGVTPDAYTAYYCGMTMEQFVNTYVEDMVRQDIALQAIANREGLTVDDEELDQTLQEYADQGGYSSVSELMGDITREEYRNYFMNEKVTDFLLGK